jgi:hypothetical protein
MPSASQGRSLRWAALASATTSLVGSLPLVRQEFPSVSSSAPAESPGCVACDAFQAEAGFFSVVNDCQNYDVNTFIQDDDWLRNGSWVRQNMPHCLMALTSSLGMARPSSFMRHDVPIASFMEQFGVIVGRTASVAGAYAYDAAFWGESKGGEEHQLAPCINESEHARGRIELLAKTCARTQYPSWGVFREAYMRTPLNCRFSSLEAMARAHREYSELESNLTGVCMTKWPRAYLAHNQVQLRYGPGDILGVVAKASRQLPHAARLMQWLSELTGKRLDTVLLTPDGCRCLGQDEERFQAKRSEMPLVPYQQPPAAQKGTCGLPVTLCPVMCAAPPVNLLRHSNTSHVQFVRIPHTGGSVVACATRDWEGIGWWTTVNPGLDGLRWPSGCAQHCSDHRKVLVITVRNPYAYWWSQYQAAVSCGGEGRNCSMLTSAATSLHRMMLPNPPRGLSFRAFLLLETKVRGSSQSDHIHSLCGNPCRYDYVLRAETLQTDWIALLAQLSFPLRRLPLAGGGLPEYYTQLEEQYTPELDSLVREVEAFVFERFKYPVGRFHT